MAWTTTPDTYVDNAILLASEMNDVRNNFGALSTHDHSTGAAGNGASGAAVTTLAVQVFERWNTNAG